MSSMLHEWLGPDEPAVLVAIQEVVGKYRSFSLEVHASFLWSENYIVCPSFSIKAIILVPFTYL